MAKPIKETPVLKGNDARKFVSDNRQAQKATAQEKEKIKASYEAIRSIANFAI